MTSAPRSASSRPPEGPATMWLSSRTRKPVSGRRPVPPLASPSVICDIFLQVVTTRVRPVARRWQTSHNEASASRRIFLTHSIATGGIVNFFGLTLLLDSGGFGFHVAHASSLIVRAIETEGPPERDRAKNRAIQPRQVHDPGIQEEPLRG